MSGCLKILLALALLTGCGGAEKKQETTPSGADGDKSGEDETPIERGERLYQELGCKTCHSTDGSSSTGPSFQGLWGTEEVLEDGSRVLVTADYVRRSILEPQADVVRGFEPQMPSFRGKLSDEQIAALVVFIASLP